MYRSRSSPIADWITTIVFCGVMVSLISEGLGVGILKAVLILIAGIATLLSIAKGIFFILDWRKSVHERRDSLKPCAHNIVAGASGRCESCEQEKERQADEQRRDRESRERLATIARNAKEVREAEVQRLSKAWLSNADSYYSMSPRRFEDAIAELFRKLGYTVKQTPYSNDGGKDAILSKDGKKFIVECKRYDELSSVGRRDVQIFVAAMHDEGATEGFYVNTGTFTSTAKEYAFKNHVTPYDRHTFASLVNEAYPVSEDSSKAATVCLQCGAIVDLPVDSAPVTGSCPSGHVVKSTITRSDLRIFTPTGVPYCEKCGSAMRIVKGYRGQFWGCTRYPKCRNTKKLSAQRHGDSPSATC